MYNTFVYKLANSNDGDVLITADNVTVPVKLTQVDVSHSTDGSQVDIACSVMFEKHGRTYDVASMYPKTTIPYNTPKNAAFREAVEKRVKEKCSYDFRIENVIFNGPATIVVWKDGTKTVVKCQEGDTFDDWKGLATAIAKRALGDKSNYNEVFKKWISEADDGND